MPFPVVTAVGEGCIDASLCGVRMAANRVNFADNRNVQSKPSSLDGSTQAGQSGTDYQDIMLIHPLS